MLVSKINLFSANQVSKNYFRNSIPTFGVNLNKKPTADVFQKSENAQQKNNNDSKSFSEFKNWAKDRGYFYGKSMPVLTLIDDSNASKTYLIGGTDNWVLKRYNRAEIIPGSHSKTVVQKVKDVIPEINIGQTIARVEEPINESYSSLYFINKKQSGHPVVLPVESANQYYHYMKEDIQTFKNNIGEIANAPQEAYDKLINNTRVLLSKGYKIDTENPENIIYDTKNKEFHIKNISIQNVFGENIAEWYANHDKPITDYSNIFTAMLGGKYGIKYYQDTHNKDYKNSLKDENLRNNVNRILLKYTSAMKLNGTCFNNTDSLNKILHSGVLDGILLPKDSNSRFDDLQRITIE